MDTGRIGKSSDTAATGYLALVGKSTEIIFSNVDDVWFSEDTLAVIDRLAVVRSLDLQLQSLEKRIKLMLQSIKELEKAKTPEEEVIELRVLDKQKARNMILEYVNTHPRCLTSDIIMELELDPDLVIDVLDELESEGAVIGGDPMEGDED